MSFMDKYTLYDWHGSNQALFKTINHLYASPSYDSAMLFLTHFFSVDNYPYFMGALIVYALLTASIRKLRGQTDGKKKHYLTMWLGVLAVIAVSFVAVTMTVKTLKEDFDYPRPYVALKSDEVRLLEKNPAPMSDLRSFPSGNAAFITLMVASLWPVLSRDMRRFGMILVPAVCWSRIAVGSHFPADVLAGFLISLVIVLLVRRLIYWLLDTLFGLKC